jgi:hypothetical protein
LAPNLGVTDPEAVLELIDACEKPVLILSAWGGACMGY